MEKTERKELKKNHSSVEDNRTIFYPLCGRRLKVSFPLEWRLCSYKEIGIHLLFVKSEGNKVILEVAKE